MSLVSLIALFYNLMSWITGETYLEQNLFFIILLAFMRYYKCLVINDLIKILG